LTPRGPPRATTTHEPVYRPRPPTPTNPAPHDGSAQADRWIRVYLGSIIKTLGQGPAPQCSASTWSDSPSVPVDARIGAGQSIGCRRSVRARRGDAAAVMQRDNRFRVGGRTCDRVPDDSRAGFNPYRQSGSASPPHRHARANKSTLISARALRMHGAARCSPRATASMTTPGLETAGRRPRARRPPAGGCIGQR